MWLRSRLPVVPPGAANILCSLLHRLKLSFSITIRLLVPLRRIEWLRFPSALLQCDDADFREPETLSTNQGNSPSSYTRWMGKPVFLNMIVGDIRTSLRCTILSEANATVRVRIADGWDVDVYKDMILAVGVFPRAGMAAQVAGEFGHGARSSD